MTKMRRIGATLRQKKSFARKEIREKFVVSFSDWTPIPMSLNVPLRELQLHHMFFRPSQHGNFGNLVAYFFVYVPIFREINAFSTKIHSGLSAIFTKSFQVRVNFSFFQSIFFSCYRRTYDTLSYRCLVPCVRTEFCDGKFELLDICNENPFQMLWERSLVILKFYRRWCRCLLVLKKFQFFAGMLLFFFSFTKSTFFKLCRPSVT